MKITLCIVAAALLLCCDTAQAQVSPVTINAGGGTATDNGLKITVTENGVLTEYKGKKQYGDAALPARDQGLWTYFMLERRWGYLPGENTELLYPTGCEISDVEGAGTAADPWKVVKLLSLKNKTDATFNISAVYTYQAGQPWYRVDYFVSSNEQGALGSNYGPYLLHIFHSESSWIHEANCGLGFADQDIPNAADAYQEVHSPGSPGTLKGRVGVRKQAGTCTAPAGSHFFRTADGATSYNARDASARDFKNAASLGYKLADIITDNGPEVPGGVAIHKAILLGENTTPGWIRHAQKSFIVGFDETDDGPAVLQDPGFTEYEDMAFQRASVGFSSAAPQGLEGNGDHVIDGVWLRVRNARFNLPQVVHIRVTTTGTGTGHAGPGDYTVRYEKMILPAGTYTDALLPLKNIIIHGDGAENEDKTLHLEILPNCSPHIDLAGQTTAADYTIVDDDENKIFLEPAWPALQEGQDMQVTVKMTGALRATPTVVDIGFILQTAKVTDFALEFPAEPMKVTIPANSNTATFTFKALADLIIENAETVSITAAATFGAELKTHSAAVSIADMTGADPANRVITFSAPATFEGTNMQVTASLPAGVTTETPITLDITHNFGSPGHTADMWDVVGNALPASMSIPAEAGSGSFTLGIAMDAFLEPEEYIYFTAEDALHAYTVMGPVQLVLRNKVSGDRKATITFAPDYMEGTDDITGRIELPDSPSEPMVVNIFVDPSSTADQDDFTAPQTLTVTFDPANALPNVAFFKINLLSDNILEGSEALRFMFTYGDLGVEQSMPLKIYDYENDFPENRELVLVNALAEDVTEGQEIQVKVRLNNTGVTASFPVNVTVTATAASTAAAGDYTLDPAGTTLTFAPGETEKIITVKAMPDAATEGTEQLVLNFTASITTIDGLPETVTSDLTKTINILDGASTSVTFTPEAVTMAEGTQVKVTAALSFGTAAAPVTITLDGLTNSEVSATDLDLVPSVTIPAGAGSVEFYLKAVNDDVLEDDELISLNGTAAGYTITGTSLTVTDATRLVNANRQFTLQLAAASMAEGGAVNATVKLPANITTSKAIDIQLVRGAATAAGLLADEYSFPATVTIPANGSEVTFSLTAPHDNILELTEALELEAAGTAVLNGFTDKRTLDITDVTGTVAANKAITVTPAGVQTVAEGADITYIFQLPAHITAGYPVVITLGQQATPGLPADAADFTGGIDGTVTIPVNGQSAQLQLRAKADGWIETEEELMLQPQSAGFTFTPGLIHLKLQDTDLSASTIQLSVSPAGINEGGNATVTATLNGFMSASDIQVTLHRAGGSTAAAADHAPLGVITIPAGNPSGNVTVSALNDQVLENDELLEIGGTSGTFHITPVTLTLHDQTGTPAHKTISVTPASAAVTEGGSVQVKVKLPDNITAADDIDVTVQAVAGAGLGAAEYHISPATVKIPAGANFTEVTIAATDDQLIESSEQLTLNATATVYGSGPQTASAAITILDAPGHNVITAAVQDAEITEGGTTVIRFSLPSGVTAADDILIALAAGGAAGSADFTGLPVSVTIPAGAGYGEVSLTAVREGLIEPLESLVLTPSLAGYTFNGTAALNVKDADLTAASILLSVPAPTVQEGQDVTVTAILQGNVTATADIDIILDKTGSAAQDADHSPVGIIRIPAGQLSATAIISALADLVVEPDETLALGGSAGSIPVTGTAVVIRDATAHHITLTPAAANGMEGQKVLFTISLPQNITTAQAIHITLTKDAGTTVTDGEYILPPAVTIPAGGSSVAFEVEALADQVLEADERLNILATAAMPAAAETAAAAFTIQDATHTYDNTLIQVSGDTEVTEGNTASVTFRLPPGVTTAQPLVISLTAGPAAPAVAAADITGGIPVSVTIPAQGDAVTLQLAAAVDAVIEPVEKLFLVPEAPGFRFSNNVMLDVKDQHHSGTITFSTDRVLISEGSETAIITVSLPGSLVAGADIRVDVLKEASSAADADHSALPAFVIIEAGKHAAVFTITAPADKVLEAEEQLVISGAAPGYSIAGTAVRIADATSADAMNKILRLTPAGATVTEGATANFAVQLPEGITSASPVTVTLSKTTGASSAADTDHTQLPVSVTIPAGQNASAAFNISAVPDLVIEPQEKLRIDGSAPAGFTFEGTDIFITDATGSEPAHTRIRILPDSATLHEGSTSKVVITLAAGVTAAADIVVNITADAAAAAGMADYSITPSAVVIPKGQTQVTVVLEALQDHLLEPAEQLVLTGTAAGYTVVPAPAVTIPGDPAPQLTVTASALAGAAEPAVNGAFRLQLSAPAPADVTVTYTIGGTATAGEDYETLTGQVVIKAGETSLQLPVIIKDDAVVEGPETVAITLQHAVFSFLGQAVECTLGGVATMQLADNDEAALIIEKVADAGEPATAGSVRVRFANPQASAALPVSVSYSVSGTALAGADYVALPGVVVVPAGSNGVVVPVQALDDQQLDGAKTVIIRLTAASSPLAGAQWPIGVPAETSVNIHDNDVVSMEIFGVNAVAEGNTVPVTLKASQAIQADVAVTIQLQHDAARTVTTSVPRQGDVLTVVMPAGQTEVSFTITVTENDVNDDNGYVNLLIQPFSGAGEAYGKGASSNTATVVTDNDPLEITFRQDTVRTAEGNSGQTMMPFTLQLSRMSSRPVTVQYEFADAFEGAGADKDPQRARAGTDFAAWPVSITIPPMQATADIVVSVTGDTQQEADKYFALKLTGATVAGGRNTPVLGAQRTAAGVIENDDAAVDMEIRPHKGVSPNGDGKNDTWIIENLEKYPRNEVVIVNRWGGTIFKTANYHNTSNYFSGIANAGSGAGKELPDGSYFYVLQVWGSDGKVTRYNGYIVIKNGQ